MEGASTTHKEEDDGQAPRLLDAPVKIQDQEGNDREGLDFMWGTDKVGEKQDSTGSSAYCCGREKDARSPASPEGLGRRDQERSLKGARARRRRAVARSR